MAEGPTPVCTRSPSGVGWRRPNRLTMSQTLTPLPRAGASWFCEVLHGGNRARTGCRGLLLEEGGATSFIVRVLLEIVGGQNPDLLGEEGVGTMTRPLHPNALAP